MKQPENKTSTNTATAKIGKPVAGAAIDNRPAAAGGSGSADAAQSEKPMVDSALVGSAKTPRPAAKKRQASEKPVAASPQTDPTPKESTVPQVDRKPQPIPAATEAAPKVIEVRKAGFFPTLLGGVIAAGLGAGATYWAIPQLPEGWRPASTSPAAAEAQLEAARAAGSEAAKTEVAAQLDAISQRASDAGSDAARQALADLPAPPATDNAASDAALAEIRAALQAQQDHVAALEKAISDSAASGQPAQVVMTPAPASQGPDTAALQTELDQLRDQLQAQESRLQELAARPAMDAATAARIQQLAGEASSAQQQIAEAASQAEARIASVEAQARELEQTADAATRRAQAIAAVGTLQTAIESGAPRETGLAALQAAGVPVPAVLMGDIPTLGSLQASFDPAARSALRSVRSAEGDGGAMGAIGNFLRVQTGARSVEPREGADPDAILSRAGALVRSGDLAGALGEIGQLPPEAQAAMTNWVKDATVWVEANAALATLAAGTQ